MARNIPFNNINEAKPQHFCKILIIFLHVIIIIIIITKNYDKNLIQPCDFIWYFVRNVWHESNLLRKQWFFGAISHNMRHNIGIFNGKFVFKVFPLIIKDKNPSDSIESFQTATFSDHKTILSYNIN